MRLSIVIPYYNGESTIGQCLDSIYSQGLSLNEYEVLCIDDCSPDPASATAVMQYKYQNEHPSNLILISHDVNKRQGGARNTGIRAAKGEWILFVDQDDFFIKESIPKALSFAEKHSEMAMIMFDCFMGDGLETPHKGIYASLSQDVMTGAVFMQDQPVSWFPWSYIYRRENILASGLLFEENVRFEDVDFVVKFIVHSDAICFVPVILLYHVVHEGEQSYIGNDKEKINDLLKLEHRIVLAADDERKEDWKTGQAMMNHAIVQRKAALKRYLWRLSYNDMIEILHNGHYSIKTNNLLVDFSNNHIKLTASVLTFLKPLFALAAAIKHSLYNFIHFVNNT